MTDGIDAVMDWWRSTLAHQVSNTPNMQVVSYCGIEVVDADGKPAPGITADDLGRVILLLGHELARDRGRGVIR